MMDSVSRQLERRWCYSVYFALSLISLTFAIALNYLPGAYFQRFFSGTNPIFVIGMASGLGALALWMLQSNYGFVLLNRKTTLRGMSLSAVLATVLAVVIIIADFMIRYPQDTNVPIPQALLFYPAIGFVAEIAFHLLPLAILLVVFKPLVGRIGRERVVWIGILLVACFEPTYQVLLLGRAFMWSDAYTWIHIFVISVLQLYVFWRFDFVSMYLFRLVYYMHWHILWGVIRLDVLF